MAAVLVDYENVWGKHGLKGVEYLEAGDILYIFYSQCCNRIRAEYMDAIKAAECDFRIYKLACTGKNALDFYIASECGVLSQSGETQIVIISNDKGFKAVADFFQLKKDTKETSIIIASNIESGLMALNSAENAARCQELQERSQMLDIAVEHARYTERNSMKNKLRAAFLGTAYEHMISRICEYADENQEAAPRQLYTGSLHLFGRKDGTAIYQILKTVV
ncbi:MAG: hypothetical protein K2M91_03610 [Lachnospiraceae bacterium]|nr:hypothetical protein [Lachnospiraceae bacterium]